MASPSYRLIVPPANRSFVFKWEPFDLTTRWHYHPEVELIYFMKGETTGVIGDSFHRFREGDLVLLGANFPHVLQESREYLRQHPGMQPFGLIIQFTESFLGESFMEKPELAAIRQLLQKARRGLIFNPSAREKVARLLEAMPALTDSRKLLSLLEVLVTLSEGRSYQYLTPKHYTYDHTVDEERMRRINAFVYAHFNGPISLAEVAATANMTETSFCRYFKSRTLKSFTRFLNEVRIAYACKLLDNSAYSVSEVGYESGFNHLSYFTRQFRMIMQQTPQEYRRWKREAV